MIRLAFYIRDSQEIDRRHVPLISEAIRSAGGIEESYVSAKAEKVSILRGPAQLADLHGTLCVPAQYTDKWCRRQTMFFLGRRFKSHHPQ